MNTTLERIRSELLSGKAINEEDGLYLFRYPKLADVAAVANCYREQLHGHNTYFNRNLHLNATNVCEASCLFCSFARLTEGMPSAYTMSLKVAQRWIASRYQHGMTEIHIVNGLHPDLEFEYYEELLGMIRREFPALHVKAFTAVEIHYFAEKYGMSYRHVLERLVAAGLGSLPGGGAEIFSARVRKKICRDKVDGAGWLEVHRTAHALGLKSNCTMMYGTIETIEERIDHLIQLRTLQNETGGFQAFIPLAFHNDGNRMARLPSPSVEESLRTIAVSRIMLHNVPHIKAYWVSLGVTAAQTAQFYGANDMDGTVTEEKIYHMAGSQSPDALPHQHLIDLITQAGREPVERNTIYQVINTKPPAGSLHGH